MTDARIYIHVGLPKCGSTSIQAHFADQDAAHRACGLVYPVSSRTPTGYRSHRPLSQAPSDALPALLDEIAFESRGADRVLLSCESWSDRAPAGQARALADALRKAFDPARVTVVAWFRNPVRFIESAYAQFLVGGLFDVPKQDFFAPGTASPCVERFVAAAHAAKGFAPFDYLAWIAAVEDVFAGIEVVARSMEGPDLVHRDVVRDACALVGVPMPSTAPARNTRRDVPTLLALQYAQAHLPAGVFSERRRRTRRFALSTAGDWDAAHLRHQDLHVSAALWARIADQMDRDCTDLARRFSTSVDALCTLPASGPLSKRELSEKERAEAIHWFRTGPGARKVSDLLSFPSGPLKDANSKGRT